MRQILLDKGAITIKELSEPLLDERSVLVRVHYSYISAGTETATIAAQDKSLLADWRAKWTKVQQTLATHGYQGTKAIVLEKLNGTVQPLGYSCSGQVVAVGARVTGFAVGDWVACGGSSANHADVVCVPEQLVVKISENIVRQASITTVGAIALQGMRRAQLQLGETVCVIGLGLLGQLTVQLAKLAGCRVIGVDLMPERLELARTLGADLVFHATSAGQEIAYVTGHHGVDATLVTAAGQTSAIMQQAMEVTRKKGKVVIVGDVGLQLQRSPLYEKEIDVLISCSYGPGRYDAWYEQYGMDYPYAYVRWTENRNMQAIVQLLAQGTLNVDALSTVVPVEQALQAYQDLAAKKVLGVVVDYSPVREAVVDSIHFSQGEKHSPRTAFERRAESGDNLRLGIVGCGGFARLKLLPIIGQLKDVRVTAVVDRDVANATKVAKGYGAARLLVDDAQLFAEDLVDAVVISSPHLFHAAQLARALDAGKAVFVEKPLVTTYEQLQEVRDVLVRNPHARLTVDFNRPFSPFMQKIKQAFAQRTGPLLVQYRMSTGYTPAEHWTQTEVGGGQIIGQACHIFDLFCFLTGSKPVAVSVETTGGRVDSLASDNCVATIRFADGSVCSLLLTSVGHTSAGKEYMELHCDGKTVVMEDFMTLKGYGVSGLDTQVRTPDKGHQALVQRFFAAVKDNSAMPIPLDYLCMVSELTLTIDELARRGGGQSEV